MTSKEINWDKFSEMLERSQTVVNDFARLDEISKARSKLIEQRNELDKEENTIKEKYRQEYTSKLNDRLDDYGVLTIVTSSDHDEGHIISVTEDEMKVRYTYDYGSRSTMFTISPKELKEKGYVKVDWDGRTIYVVDNIKDPLGVFEIIKLRLRSQVGQQLNSLQWAEKEIAEYTQRAADARKELEKYKKVSDSMITRVFNDISFGVTNLKIDDLLKALPREICIYKENKEEK